MDVKVQTLITPEMFVFLPSVLVTTLFQVCVVQVQVWAKRYRIEECRCEPGHKLEKGKEKQTIGMRVFFKFLFAKN